MLFKQILKDLRSSDRVSPTHTPKIEPASPLSSSPLSSSYIPRRKDSRPNSAPVPSRVKSILSKSGMMGRKRSSVATYVEVEMNRDEDRVKEEEEKERQRKEKRYCKVVDYEHQNEREYGCKSSGLGSDTLEKKSEHTKMNEMRKPSASAAFWIGVPHRGLDCYVKQLSVYQELLEQQGFADVGADVPPVPKFEEPVTERGMAYERGKTMECVIGKVGSYHDDGEKEEESSYDMAAPSPTSLYSYCTTPEVDYFTRSPRAADFGFDVDGVRKRNSAHLKESGGVLKNAVYRAPQSTCPQTATMFARDASSSMLERYLGPTTCSVQYSQAQKFGWRLQHSESVFCVPEFLAYEDTVKDLIVQKKGRIVYIGAESKKMRDLVKKKWDTVISKDLAFNLSLHHALASSSWSCSSSAKVDRAAGHDPRSCGCEAKSRNVLVCLMVADDMRIERDEFVISSEIVHGKVKQKMGWDLLIPLRIETFGWKADSAMELGAIAEYAKRAVEESVAVGFAAKNHRNW